MHAFLIIGKTGEDRREEIANRVHALAVRAFDEVRLSDSPSIGITDIREFIHALAMAPLGSHTKAGVLWALDRLTPEAQNALLKTIEEPPPNTVILAETEMPEAILPTIRSRFTIHSLGGQKIEIPDQYQALITDLLSVSVGKRIQLTETVSADRETARDALSALTSAGRGALLSAVRANDEKTQTKLVKLLRALFIARSQLSVNVNPKLVIDNVVIHIA